MQRELKKDLNLKLKRYAGKINKLHTYRSIEDDPLGINYKSFLKIRYETFNKNHILKRYTIEGWRILCYLVTKAKDYKYIMITPSIIQKELNIKSKSTVYRSLNYLFSSDIIYGTINKNTYSEKIKVKSSNDLLDIIITYADDDYYPYENEVQGFRPIPLDLVGVMVKDLSAEEWVIYCLLLVRYRYYCLNDTIDRSTGELITYINEYLYAFPPQDSLAELLGCERKKMNKITKALEEKGYIEMILPKKENKAPKIKKDINGNIKITRTCIQYKIKLMTRSEYIYHYIMTLDDNKAEAKAKKIGINKYIEELKLSGKINLNTITNKIFLLMSSIYPEIDSYLQLKKQTK